MAMEESFSLEFAVKRFLSRCPELGKILKLKDLLNKGHEVTEEEVVNVVAELFLNPNYTIPLIGCFWPLAHNIIDEAVSLLGQLNLSCNLDDMVVDAKEFFNAEAAYIIDHFDRSRNCLVLHELACLAFCRAFDLDRSLLGSAVAYFKFAPPPFQRVLKNKIVVENSKDASCYVFTAQLCYRILLMEPEFFSVRWDWSCFLELVMITQNLNLIHDFQDEVILDIRWCAIQIMSITLKMSDKAIENFGVGAEEAASCFLRWEEFSQDVAVEKAGLYMDPSMSSVNGTVDFNKQNFLRLCEHNSLAFSQHCKVAPMVKSRKLVTWNDLSGGRPFVMTSTMKRSFDIVLLAVSQRWPILLYGPSGAGKTALISKLAQDSGNQVLTIHMDEQIDGKTLLGTYVCAEQPGEFRWQPGSLIQAVLNGYWVVFEDIDKAPSDVQSILLPLLEGESFFITGHGEEIKVPESFRVFSTITTSKNDGFCNAEGGNLLSILWRRVLIGLPNNEDFQNIVKAWYPDLEPLVGKLIETFEQVNSLYVQHVWGFQSESSSLSVYQNRFSLRDLLKWCKRIAGLGFSPVGNMLTAYQCRCIYQEAVDVFVAFSASSETRLTIMKEIARLWKIPPSEEGILNPCKPEIQGLLAELRIGRVTVQRTETVLHCSDKLVKMRSSLHVLERICCSVKYNEPVLLVGETGTGKTTLVQNLATMLGQRLTVLNLSQQSDVADLLGGFKPIDPQKISVIIYKEFESLFSKTFSVKENDKLFAYLQKQLRRKNWTMLLNAFKKYVDNLQKKLQAERSGSGMKRKKPLNEEETLRAWDNFSMKLETAIRQVGASSGMMFSFIEGAFVGALKNGEWILLDEVNLAPPETLQRITGVLEGDYGSLCLAERGDISHIPRHPSFRIFGCMNPATDAGKRDLPYSLRSRFTEYFVDDVLDKEDLKLFINKFMEETRSNSELEERIIDLYGTAKMKSEERLQDGANQKPQYSLRSLYRALEYTREAKGKFGFQKAVYDGFCMFFLTMLDKPSAKIMKETIKNKLLGGNKPSPVPFEAYLKVKVDSSTNDFLENYVITKSVKKQLENLARAVFIKRYPVLLQGPTSSGKTSLVQYLAAKTGHAFVRINNHEHTDLQEYLGSYISDAHGKLVFQEGVLVKAVRSGYWIVLDELNLAPSDVLEALNRLLDDNRELFVPELNETIRAHPNFMLFATQNPPTFYGGRKMLSRAFRNRFVEVHVDEIPDYELSTIIEKRCKIPASRAKIMVEVMKELQLHRQRSKVFAGKHGFITPRDLFRWANRLKTFGNSKEVMAEHGYYLLADRLRDEGEKLVVQEVLEKHLRVKIVKENLYKDLAGRDSQSIARDLETIGNIILTKSMRRLYFLVKHCYELHDPVLLIGETGGGKTTVCQLLSSALGSKLHILNCHQYSETSDFIGGFYPIRERSRLASEYKSAIEKLKVSKACINFPDLMEISFDIGHASSTLDHLGAIINSYRRSQLSSVDVTMRDLDALEEINSNLSQLYQKWQMIFMWQDGPLVQAMKAGDLFLVDEISLADDSVLERLNSVLEPERKLSLAEKGGSVMENITAHENFLVLATMNPGGDYGKKELSPALRNRFTEIWVPPVGDLDELRNIASNKFPYTEFSYIVDSMINFWEWFNQLQAGRILTVRDLLSWIEFINITKERLGVDNALFHGLFLVLLDGLCLGTGLSKEEAGVLREKCLSFLVKQLKLAGSVLNKVSIMNSCGWADFGATPDMPCADDMVCDNVFGISPFYVEKGYEVCKTSGFQFLAPTTRKNALRVLRAMQLPKPVLLEGSPGVGKTSLIVALGKYSGHKVVRINLSEQTDLMDLLGSDLPVESDEGMKFAWSDGILLQALKEGCWVLLDELNLAPQSVLEGLNAILDHRAEVFIPELGHTFKCPSSFRVFACQNPFSQGGGRKGLPRSFLNRFTKVYVDELAESDYLFISSSLYPSIPKSVLSKLILFNKRLHEDIMVYHKFAQDGSPWEFNLRDVIRSCEIIQGAPETLQLDSVINILYVQRMRTPADRKEVLRLCEEVFGVKPLINSYPRVQLNNRYLIAGDTAVKRNTVQLSKHKTSQLNILPSVRHSFEAAMRCLHQNWLCILVGPSSSGKTSLIKLLAELTGNVLNELHLSSATDISELVGCFEQYDAYRNFRSIGACVERYVSEYCSSLLEFSKVAFCESKDVITKWLAFSSRVDFTFLPTSTLLENWQRLVTSLDLLVEIIELLKVNVVKNGLTVSWSIHELNRTMEAISKLLDYLHRRQFSGKFEWVAGKLIKAIENGEWVVLENANLCNPTVLDRINSLVEPSGTITVNECGIVDGSPVVLHPHPNFRMFLTVNPRYGEISRAMRNRGVEIFMMQPYWLLHEGSSAEFELKDVKSFIVLSGVPVGRIVESMANAHVYARKEAMRLNVQITYLELARWIKLFQQLVINGGKPFWSVQKSWEHIYLSALGESAGLGIIDHAKLAFLSVIPQSESNLPVESSLVLPKMLKLKDFVFYSKESSVKQNCMYLEYLISQYECTSLLNDDGLYNGFSSSSYAAAHMRAMRQCAFPEAAGKILPSLCKNSKYDLNVARKMTLFAATWAIEQATEIDYRLYLLLFSWFGSKLQHGHFFHSFMHLLEQEFEHSIWKCIFQCHHELVSLHQIDLMSCPIPLLSLDLVNLTQSSDMSKSSCKLLSKAIHSVGLLRLSYEQWNVQSDHEYSNETLHFKLVLDSLQGLEKEILDMLVTSSSYDLLFKLYTKLLDDHIMFWKSFFSFQFEHLQFSWHSLVKDVSKFLEFFPRAVENVLMLGHKHLDKEFYQGSQRSLLWIYGGHPILPPTAKLNHKLQQLLDLCDTFWQPYKNPYKQVDDCFTNMVAASDPELRFLTVQGICMSLYITSKYDEDHDKVLQQLEEMLQMLLKRLGFEKRKSEAKVQSYERGIAEGNSTSCCIFFPEILYTKSSIASWQDAFPIPDSTSIFLDMELLQKLSTIILIDPRELHLALGSVSSLLESALKYSLAYSARPPQNFVPHQKILWTIEAWASVNAVNTKLASYVLEMWFWWHLSLWSHCPVSVEGCSKVDGYDIPVPAMLAQPVKTSSVICIMQESYPIKDYFVYLSKLELASQNVWQSPPTLDDIPNFLSSVARSLFQQIVYAYQKVFDADRFAAISSMFYTFQKKMITQDEVQNLCSLITSSNDQRLNSLMHPMIEPLLKKLYLNSSSTDFYLNVGYAWLWIGRLRFRLLLNCSDMDPAMKYSFKHSQIQEKVSSLELEIQVRQECDHLAGWRSLRNADKKRVETLQMLEVERKRLQRKMVFRSNPSKFNALRKDCKEFLKRVMAVMDLVSNVEDVELQHILVEVCDWQKTATCFIEELSDDYKEYTDVAQPVQVAVYEMKLGLSLILSGALYKRHLNMVEVDNMDQFMESICSFMRFPREYTLESISSNDISSPSSRLEKQANVLEKLVSISCNINAEKGTLLQHKISLHLNILVRVASFVSDAQRMDNTSFKLLDKMFNEFASLWMNMKIQVKSREGHDAQQYKFRPRAFEMKHVIDVDVSTFGKLLSDENASEWIELLSADECLEKAEAGPENENLEEEWNIMQEDVLNNMIQIHNQLFGSVNLVLSAGTFHVSDADRLFLFTNSYSLGSGIIRGLGGPASSTLDAKLVPEHLLRLSLEHERLFVSSHKASPNYKFYKDSNASELAKMVKLLTSLQQKILSLLNEWEDHPGLRKMIDAIDMLLVIPMSTPLGKALLGLRFLINRARVLEENGSKFSFSDQLEPIIALVCSWQKMGYDSWPALLNEVQDQYEINAAKLWFPLFSVLYNSHASEVPGHEQYTIESLEEFINTSSVGEFKRRLQLLLAFLGHITAGRCLEVETYSSPWQGKIMDILYNVFGYYIQFLPRILKYIETSRRNIEMELKEHLKMCHWERVEVCLSAESSKRNLQKLRKIVQKYSDVLQQPVMLILNQESVQKGISIKTLKGPILLNDISETNTGLLNAVLDQFSDEDRLLWFPNWKENVNDTLQNLCLDKTPELCPLDVASLMQQCLTSQSACSLQLEQWNAVHQTLEKICRVTIDCDDLWKDMEKSIGKRRAFSELLKLLESSGLHKHKFEVMNISNNSNWLFLQPSYDGQHLLLTSSRLPHEASAVSELQCQPDKSMDTEWKIVNEFYFKSMASVQLLQQMCLKPHEDISYEQASRSISFLNHLIVIQQSQRESAYGFTKHLKCLRECISALENLYSSCSSGDKKSGSVSSISLNQNTILECMWKQKQLFDSLVATLVEESLLLKTVENTHPESCQNVKPATNYVLHFIENFIPIMKKSKESLDNYLLGGLGVMQTLMQEASDKCILHRVGTFSACHMRSARHMRPYVVSKQMEELVYKNFQVIKQFEEHLVDFRKQDLGRSSVTEVLLHRFDGVFEKGKMLVEELKYSLNGKSLDESTNTCDKSSCCDGHCSENDAMFDETLRRAFGVIMNVLKKQCSSTIESVLSEEFLGNITSWEFLFQSSVENLNLQELYDCLLKTIFYAEKMVTCHGSEASALSFHIGACLEHIHTLSDLILTLGDDLLRDLLSMHKMVSVMTHVLASVLASLFSKGFGIPAKEEGDDANNGKPQDATGTGMGEGLGVNDVSEQITDEDQLLGSSEKPSEEQETSGEAPNKNEKGIEMEQDFTADTFSVSEDSEEENDQDNDDDGQLESAMGETGPESEAIDEKHWDKEEDENPNDRNEKYESGPSVTEKDASSRELRAKDDSAASEEPGEPNADELNKQNDEIGNEDDNYDREDSTDDMQVDKEQSVADPTGLELDDSREKSDEDMDADEGTDADEGMNGKEEFDSMEVGPEDCNESSENQNLDESTENQNLDESAENDNKDETAENGKDAEEAANPVDDMKEENVGEDGKENLEKNSSASMQDVFGHGVSDLVNNHMPNTASASQPNGDSQVSDSRNIAHEGNMSSTSEAYNRLAPQKNLPSGPISEMDLKVYDPSNNGKVTSDQQKAELPQKESLMVQKTQPNPYRNVGDALEEWKERVNATINLGPSHEDVPSEVEDKIADEYGYVPEFEKGTAQTLGPATSEQIDPNISNKMDEEDNSASLRDDIAEMEIDKQISEEWHLKNHGAILKNKTPKIEIIDSADPYKEGSPDINGHDDGDRGTLSESLVSVQKSYLNEDIYQLSKLTVEDSQLGIARDHEDTSLDIKQDASALWRRYELHTTRLSQELAEQLRLVLEPTLASKLQGDYKTGKRINMKKVIPYIASHYRKDKIWLRRTRPNKRDYQVVIAVDDSRSMSESSCGDVAVESLVTVCRAMSQLEMGNLAVASFGKKGNVRLLHDFHQPFNGEAGVKIISSLTFRQENTIADEPVVDLLTYLNNMLDGAVVKARLPSGQNPLQQLVLIIADGRFHEKEKLKRCVRDFLSRKRMVAFLLLDSPQESIMDQMEATFVGEGEKRTLKFTKYLDSFPFPYYVVLRNTEALPRTLADLLRQWFEIMQYSRD